ncbi:MAG: TonB family protein [Candidatus Cybelea sp.]
MKRAPRLLLVAIALSLLIHLIIALILHPPSPTPESQAEVVSIQHRPATIAVTKTTPPPPRPKQTPAPRTRSSAPPARKGPGTTGTSGGTAAPPTPIVARVTPQPTAAPSGACTQPNTEAAVVATPSPPDIPIDTRASGTSGVAQVSVQLDATGQVTGAGVKQSTGNSSLDLVAVGMARDARYSPALRDCKPIAGTYAFSVKFVAW